jgi:hypothetical protein
MQVVTLQYQHQILACSTLGSPVQDVVTPDDEDIDYDNDGLDDDEGDVKLSCSRLRDSCSQ